ncbi:hypothetical protein Tco_0360128 [Tanacetum coccineum]
MVNEKWKTVRPKVAQFNVTRREVSGVVDGDYTEKELLEYQVEDRVPFTLLHSVCLKVAQFNVTRREVSGVVDGDYTRKEQVDGQRIYKSQRAVQRQKAQNREVLLEIKKEVELKEQELRMREYEQHFLVLKVMDLECEVTKEELKRAVWDCGVDKSSGPDGFSFGFYRHFWSSIENDMFSAVRHFFTFADIPKGCNSSFIALIPKIPNANLVKDFRPLVSLVASNKIIAKILSNIEVLQWCKSKKKQSLIFKVDFEKAFDSVRWDFLDDILRKFGFGTKVGDIMTRAEAWKEVIDKVAPRLSKWKMRALSIGGRLTLLKSVLGSIPIFYMSIYRVPASVLKKLEANQMQLL